MKIKDAVFNLIENNPGLTGVGIARLSRLPWEKVRSALTCLLRTGAIYSEGDSFNMVYYVKGK